MPGDYDDDYDAAEVSNSNAGSSQKHAQAAGQEPALEQLNFARKDMRGRENQGYTHLNMRIALDGTPYCLGLIPGINSEGYHTAAAKLLQQSQGSRELRILIAASGAQMKDGAIKPKEFVKNLASYVKQLGFTVSGPQQALINLHLDHTNFTRLTCAASLSNFRASVYGTEALAVGAARVTGRSIGNSLLHTSVLQLLLSFDPRIELPAVAILMKKLAESGIIAAIRGMVGLRDGKYTNDFKNSMQENISMAVAVAKKFNVAIPADLEALIGQTTVVSVSCGVEVTKVSTYRTQHIALLKGSFGTDQEYIKKTLDFYGITHEGPEEMIQPETSVNSKGDSAI
jgi:hypothetical protein